jgi:hypothetical protein
MKASSAYFTCRPPLMRLEPSRDTRPTAPHEDQLDDASVYRHEADDDECDPFRPSTDQIAGHQRHYVLTQR